MKVLVFTSHFPSNDAPVRAPYNRDTFTALSNHVDLRVVSPFPWWKCVGDSQNLFSVRHENTHGIDAAFKVYWSVPGLTFIHARAMYASFFLYMRKIWREFPFDALITTWAYPDGTAAASFARDVNRPFVSVVLGSDINKLPNNPLLRSQIGNALAKAERVVSVSGDMADKVVRLGVPRKKIIVQHNGVDGSRFVIRDMQEARKRLGISHAGPVILYVGNLNPEKGVVPLVEAMGKLVWKLGMNNIRLIVVGSGVLENRLRVLMKNFNLEEHVILKGRQLHGDIPYWMNACDIFCLPSYREGCPNVILEALASGKPVVASRVGGIPELIRRGNGIMTPPGNPERLADGLKLAVEKNWNSAELRSSVEYLSWEPIGTMYRDLLTEIVEDWKSGKK